MEIESYMRLGTAALLTIGYLYYVLVSCCICQGRGKNTVYIVLSLCLLGIGWFAGWLPLGILGVLAMTAGFIGFYSDDKRKGLGAVLPGVALLAFGCLTWLFSPLGYWNVTVAAIAYSTLLFILLSAQRGYLKIIRLVLVLLMNGMLAGADIILGLHLFLLTLSLLLFLILETALRGYEMGYQKQSKALQEEMMQRQFGEIRDIYLNMRGWRHDYHNHIQVLKADLDNDQTEKARDYLNQIEHELDKVDTFVKSGNMMADAILNSKITMALKQKIDLNCDAFLPEELFITDTDLCTLLGNILDNALESCEKLPEEKRFIRIYLAMVKEQFYLSVQNASPEEIGFEQQHYITTKRGNHGLGMRRVAAVVERWGGFLNLSQEPGIFGTEVTIPKP